jgi:aspartate/methionine/tyrosine aminotransferase
MGWAKTVPLGARFDLTASGMLDTAASVNGHDQTSLPRRLQPWADELSTPELCTRAAATQALDAFIETVARRYGVEPDCVTPTLGASQAILHTLIGLIRAGDHVIVERPTYEPLHRAPEILGARVSRLERRFEDGWAVVPDRLAQLLTSKTRAVILSNLHNPSGFAIDADTMRQITELAARVGALVLVDEVYLDYAFPHDEHATLLPACNVADNCVSWSSTTKAFGFSAIRGGWIVSRHKEAARAIRLASDYLHVYPPVASLVLGKRVLDEADALEAEARRVAAAGRRVLERWVDAESRVDWVPPSAGLTCALRLPHFQQDVAFAEHLRERYDTQVVPGTMFEAPGFVRLSFGLPPDELEQALANVSAALDDLEG